VSLGRRRPNLGGLTGAHLSPGPESHNRARHAVFVSQPLRVGVELGPRRTFAWAVDWPGWCRSGRGQEAALAALAADGPRYFPVAAAAGASLPAGLAGDVEVVERLPGSTTTDVGAPGTGGAAAARPLSLEAGRRLASLVSAAWGFFDQVAGHAPLELCTGPRGGGRDRDQIVEHVLALDFVYARELGLTLPSRASDPTGGGRAPGCRGPSPRDASLSHHRAPGLASPVLRQKGSLARAGSRLGGPGPERAVRWRTEVRATGSVATPASPSRGPLSR
jgi:hypothetical protein